MVNNDPGTKASMIAPKICVLSLKIESVRGKDGKDRKLEWFSIPVDHHLPAIRAHRPALVAECPVEKGTFYIAPIETPVDKANSRSPRSLKSR